MPNTSTIRYSNCQTLAVNCYLYSDPSLGNAFTLEDGNYSDGSRCITVSGGAGMITAIASCGPITYVDYIANKWECSSGNIIATSVPVVLISSATPQYDNFYLPSDGSGEVGIYVYELLFAGGSGGIVLDISNGATLSEACSITP